MAELSYHDYRCVVTDLDRRNAKREVPTKVLALGICRTGTDYLRNALEILDHSEVYHGYTAGVDYPRDCEMWLEACKAKFEGIGKVYGRAEFGQLLGHCQAVSNFPCIAISEELIEAYPEAKVILTLRDVHSWHRLLEYYVDEGWEPLCQFLGCATPVVDFPTSNNVESLRKKIGAATRYGV